MTTNLHYPHESVDSTETPIVIEESGPTAGDEYVAIHDGECGNCGYDRVRVKRKYGETVEWCMLCDSRSHGRHESWERPTTDGDDLRDLREYADSDGPVVKLGEYGPSSRYTHGSEVFGYDNGTGLIKVFEHGSDGTSTERTTVTTSMLDGLLRVLERERGYVSTFVDEELDGKTITNSANAPNNPNAVHAGVLEHKGVPTALWIRMTEIPIHFDPRSDGIAV
jgi:hypothetical protein